LRGTLLSPRFISDPSYSEALVEEEGAQGEAAAGEDDASSGNNEEYVDEELEADTPLAAKSAPTDPSCSASASAPDAGNA
jgi:hypothetical protein